jgi:membrane-bound lytic murein transglycosylase D
LPQKLYRHNQKRSTIYTVRRGDTAGKIAKRNGVKLNDLIAVNNLDRRATIYVNQNLRIPLPEDKSIRVAKRSNTKKKPAAPSAPASNPVPAKHAAQPTAKPTQANPMTELMLAQGAAADYRPQEQTPAPASRQQSMALKPTAHEPSLKPTIIQGHFAVDRLSIKGGKSIGHIRVEAEETLGHYAEWLNVPAEDIRRLNGFVYGRPLQLSQKIKIPLDRVAKNDFEVKRFEYHQELSEDFFASYRVERVRTYSIKKGDNIWTLSRREFEVPLWLIKHYNGDVDFGALIPSQKLLIPVVEKNV